MTTANTGMAKNDSYHDFSKYSLLVSEDNETNRERIMTLLEPTKIKLDFSVNGVDTVEKYKESPDKYDIIFMDIQMPEMDGYEATKSIRKSGADTAQIIPIIAMTADDIRDNLRKCHNCGMFTHIRKPFDYEEITEVLHACLD